MYKQKSIVKSSFEKEPQSYWLASSTARNYPTLSSDTETDVVVVGGGLAGITTAYLLKQEGVKVILIEARKILRGATGHTTAKITSLHQLIYDYLITNYGEENTKIYGDAYQSTVKFMANLISKKNIDCDFKWTSHLVYTQLDSFIEQIGKEAEAAQRVGLPAQFVTDTGLPFTTKCAVQFTEQAQFHPIKYMTRLAEEIPGDYCEIYEETRALDIEGESPLTVITDKGRIRAQKVVIASHYPFYDRKGLYFTRLYQSRSYVLALTLNGKFPEGMFINAENQTRSLRTQPFEGGELVLLGGEAHQTGHGDNTKLYYEGLRNFAEENLDVKSIEYRWSAQDAMPLDSIPYIGRLTSDTENIYVATGFKKWGMTSGTLAARIITDLIAERHNDWAELFSPSRVNISAQAGEFLKSNISVAGDLIAGKFYSSDKKIEDLKNDEGALIGGGTDKLAAFRDETGEVHVFDATCRHLGCEVIWNEAEKTWDCPCHGSRYSGYYGSVIEGPAVLGLRRPNEEKKEDFTCTNDASSSSCSMEESGDSSDDSHSRR